MPYLPRRHDMDVRHENAVHKLWLRAVVTRRRLPVRQSGED